MDIIKIITKKKNSLELTKDEIYFFINEYVKGTIADYQASALCMAICLNGMSDLETTHLTLAMRDSGDTIDLSKIEGIVADKHSTGGVADTTSLIAMPIAAACGCKIAKLSGRGLGHTGGTLDKLESIDGYNISIDSDNFFKIVNSSGLSIIGQTKSLVPADKKLYALRDVTGTVKSIPLIASSIMSKKLASGSDVIVLDVKTGTGAFMADLADAKELAQKMVSIGKSAGKKVQALVTDMNQPLGNAVGNRLEVKEAAEILQGHHKGGDLSIISFELAANMIYLSGIVSSIEEAKQKIDESIESGKAYQKFEEFIKAHGGTIPDFENFIKVKEIKDILAKNSGYINILDASEIGRSAMLLGAGREQKEDEIDYNVGILMNVRNNSYVKKGDCLAKFYLNDKTRYDEALKIFYEAIEISEKQNNNRLIY